MEKLIWEYNAAHENIQRIMDTIMRVFFFLSLLSYDTMDHKIKF